MNGAPLAELLTLLTFSCLAFFWALVRVTQFLFAVKFRCQAAYDLDFGTINKLGLVLGSTGIVTSTTALWLWGQAI